MKFELNFRDLQSDNKSTAVADFEHITLTSIVLQWQNILSK